MSTTCHNIDCTAWVLLANYRLEFEETLTLCSIMSRWEAPQVLEMFEYQWRQIKREFNCQMTLMVHKVRNRSAGKINNSSRDTDLWDFRSAPTWGQSVHN